MEGSHNAQRTGARRAAPIAAVAVALLALGLIVWYAMRMLLLAFAGILLAILLRGLTRWVARKTGWRLSWSLAAVLLGLGLLATAVGMVAAPQVARQVDELADRLPKAMQQVQDQLASREWVREALNLPPPSQPQSAAATQPASQPTTGPAQLLTQAFSDAGTGGAVRSATRFARLLLDVLVTLVLVLVVAIYLAYHPALYVHGLIRLAPPKNRRRLREVLFKTGDTIVAWLIGQGITMAIVTALTAGGLWLIGVELWFILGILAGLFNFVPNFGPLVSFIPAVLIASVGGADQMAYVALLFLIIQSLEGYIITPLIQSEAVEMPPALLIMSQVVLGALLGALGVVLAAPLTVAALVLVRELYVKDVLEQRRHAREG